MLLLIADFNAYHLPASREIIVPIDRAFVTPVQYYVHYALLSVLL